MTAPATHVSVVFSTAPNGDVAKKIARALVEERLVACVNVVANVTSIFRWQGEIEEGNEVLLVMKTASDRIPTVAARLKELHPYENPELVALPVDAALPAYAQWVVDETARVVT